jgi:hypothetical protein
LVRQSEALVELLGSGEHVVKGLPRLLGAAEDELLDFFELVDPENAPCVFAVGSGFFAEVGRVACILDWKVGGGEPFLRVQCGDGLLGGGDQILVCLGLVLALGDLVEFVVKVGELGGFSHDVAEHEEGGLVGRVALVEEKLETIVDEGEVEEETVACEAVAPVADDFDAALGVVAGKSCEDAVVWD